MLSGKLKVRILIEFYKRKYGVKLGKGVVVSRSTRFGGKNVVEIDSNVSGSYIGTGSYIAGNTRLIKAKVGKFCSIGKNVENHLGQHPTTTFVSTHPSFFSLVKTAGFTFIKEQQFEEHLYVDPQKQYVTEIGNDVWIGNHVKIMDGVKIGDGAVLGLGCVVTGDVEPYSINVGTPAKTIGYRFTKEQIEFLLDFRWWERSFEWIQAHAHLFSNIDSFLSELSKS